jgi:hypothetical protein
MTRGSLPWRGKAVRSADGWTITVPVQREHVAPEVRVIKKETLRLRREVVQGTAWLSHTVAAPEHPEDPTSGPSRETRQEQNR